MRSEGKSSVNGNSEELCSEVMLRGDRLHYAIFVKVSCMAASATALLDWLLRDEISSTQMAKIVRGIGQRLDSSPHAGRVWVAL